MRELYLIIIRNEEVNNLFIERFKHLIYERERNELRYGYVLLNKMNENIAIKLIRYKTIFNILELDVLDT